MNTNTNSPNNNPRDIAPEHIARLLTRATQRLDDNTVAVLRRARTVVLERQSLRKPFLALSTEYRAWHALANAAFHPSVGSNGHLTRSDTFRRGKLLASRSGE